MFLHCSKNKPRKMNVTHFQKYFASRWEIFCHSFMGMTAIRTKTTSAIRCNGMSKKMKKCWLPNRYSVELCLEGTFFFDLLHFVACSDPFDFICKTRFVYAWEKRNFSLLLFIKLSKIFNIHQNKSWTSTCGILKILNSYWIWCGHRVLCAKNWRHKISIRYTIV